MMQQIERIKIAIADRIAKRFGPKAMLVHRKRIPAGTPIGCGFEMMRKDFTILQKPSLTTLNRWVVECHGTSQSYKDYLQFVYDSWSPEVHEQLKKDAEQMRVRLGNAADFWMGRKSA